MVTDGRALACGRVAAAEEGVDARNVAVLQREEEAADKTAGRGDGGGGGVVVVVVVVGVEEGGGVSGGWVDWSSELEGRCGVGGATVQEEEEGGRGTASAKLEEGTDVGECGGWRRRRQRR